MGMQIDGIVRIAAATPRVKVADCPHNTAEIGRMIREAAVAAVPGSCFGAEGFLRLSYCCSTERLKTGLDRMEQFLKTL